MSGLDSGFERDGAAGSSLDVFICYAEPDCEAAARLKQALHAIGLTAFVNDTDLRPGDRWDIAIDAALMRARLVVVIISPAWHRGSSWYAPEEVARALDRVRDEPDVRVVPLLLGGVRGRGLPYGLACVVGIADADRDWRATARRLADTIGGRERLGGTLLGLVDVAQRAQEAAFSPRRAPATRLLPSTPPPPPSAPTPPKAVPDAVRSPPPLMPPTGKTSAKPAVGRLWGLLIGAMMIGGILALGGLTPPLVASDAPLPIAERTDPARETALSVGQVRASSSQKPYRKGGETYRFGPSHLVDRDLQTSWQEGKPGPGVGEWIELVFDAPATITRIELANGFQRRNDSNFGDLYVLNGRMTRVAILVDGRSLGVFRVDDQDGWQSIGLGAVDVRRSLRLVIEGDVAGTRWTDTALSEVRVIGRRVAL